VVTLAGLLIWQGVILKALGTQGVIGIEEHQINDIANYVLTKNWGWAVATVFTVGYAGRGLRNHLQSPASGAPLEEHHPERCSRRVLRRARLCGLQPLSRRASCRFDRPLPRLAP
jgi:ABC-type xylose transport system permease subunit